MLILFRPFIYHVAVVLKTTQFPLYYPLIIDSLDRRGFEKLVSPLPPTPFGSRIYLGGRIARRGDCYVILNPDKKVVACEGADKDETLSCFNELLKICSEDFNISGDEFDYFEVLLRYTAKPSRRPLEIIRNKDWGVVYDRVSEIIGKRVVPYVLSFAISERSPNEREWLDLRLYPDPALPDRFGIEVVFRSISYENIRDFVNEIEEKIKSIISYLET